jgi:hypothetical protein
LQACACCIYLEPAFTGGAPEVALDLAVVALFARLDERAEALSGA